MKVSVIIATYGRDACLVDTIRSVLLQNYPDFELLIVDQAANHTAEVENFLRKEDDPRYSYYLVNPPSLPAARNFGRDRASGEIVIYVDDDVLLDPNFIQAHVHAYELSERIAAVGGRVRTPKVPISTHLYRLASDGTWSGGFDFSGDGELETVRGCNMSFRRSALEAVGGFDSSYVGNALREETDVCFRVRREGHQIRYEARAALDHLAADSGGCRENQLWDSSVFYQNETLFTLKNLGFRMFILFLFNALKNYVLPHKRSLLFWSRLKALGQGVLRGAWFVVFPKKLRPEVVWESNRNGTARPGQASADPHPQLANALRHGGKTS